MKSPMERFTLVCKNWNQAAALFRAQYPVLEVKSGSVLSPPRGEPMARYLSAPTPAEHKDKTWVIATVSVHPTVTSRPHDIVSIF